MADPALNVSNLEELKSAIASANSGQTIAFTGDIDITEALTIDKDLTLDFGKRIVKGSVANALNIIKGTTTINAGVLEGNAADAFVVSDEHSSNTKLILGSQLTVKCHAKTFYVKAKGTLVIDGASVQSNAASPAIRGEGQGTLIQVNNDSNLEGTSQSLIQINDRAKCVIENSRLHMTHGKDAVTPILDIDNANLTINGGELKHQNGFILQMRSSTVVTIEGAEIESTSKNAAPIKITGDSNQLTFKGNTLTSPQYNAIFVGGKGNSLDLLSGQIESDKAKYVLELEDNPGLQIKAHFKGKRKNEWLPEGYEWKPLKEQDPDGFYYPAKKQNPGNPDPEPPKPPKPEDPGHSEEIPKSINMKNIKTTRWLYKTPSPKYPITKWVGAIKVIGNPITHQPTGQVYLPVRAKLPGSGRYCYLYVLWKNK